MLVLMVACADLAAANPLHQLILSAEEYVMAAPRREMVRILQSAIPNTPLLDRIEIRTETDDFDLSRQQYAFRVYPMGWRETEKGKEVHRAMLKSNRVRLDLLVHEELVVRYMLIVDHLFEPRLLALKQRLSVVLEDRISVLRRQAVLAQRVNVDIDDLVEAERDQTSLALELIGLAGDTEDRGNRIRALTQISGPLGVDDLELPDLAVIEELVQQEADLIRDDNIYLQNASARAALTESQYLLQKVQDEGIISFLQASYDHQLRDDPSRAYSLRLGIRLPLGSSNRLDTNRRHLRHLRERGQYEDLKRDVSRQLSLLTRDMTRQIRQCRILLEKREEREGSSTLKIYRRLEGIDPLILLKLRESDIRSEIAMANLEHSLYTTYVQWLDTTGMISRTPLKNFLSGDLETIPR